MRVLRSREKGVYSGNFNAHVYSKHRDFQAEGNSSSCGPVRRGLTEALQCVPLGCEALHCAVQPLSLVTSPSDQFHFPRNRQLDLGIQSRSLYDALWKLMSTPPSWLTTFPKPSGSGGSEMAGLPTRVQVGVLHYAGKDGERVKMVQGKLFFHIFLKTPIFLSHQLLKITAWKK